MTQVCRFSRLPVEVQREIEQRLIENGFSEYVRITEELKRRGYRISKSSLGRIGKQLKARYELAGQEKAIREYLKVRR